MNAEILRSIEALSRRRLDLARQFSARTAAALQRLDGEDVEGFSENIEAADALVAQMDALTAEIGARVPQLGGADAAAVRALLASGGEAAHPAWCAALAADRANLVKLLRNCASMNTRMESRARALTGQLRERIDRVRANRKLYSRYGAPGGAPGARVHYTSK